MTILFNQKAMFPTVEYIIFNKTAAENVLP